MSHSAEGSDSDVQAEKGKPATAITNVTFWEMSKSFPKPTLIAPVPKASPRTSAKAAPRGIDERPPTPVTSADPYERSGDSPPEARREWRCSSQGNAGCAYLNETFVRLSPKKGSALCAVYSRTPGESSTTASLYPGFALTGNWIVAANVPDAEELVGKPT